MCGWVQLGLSCGLPLKMLLSLKRESEMLSLIHLVSYLLRVESDVSWKALVAALCTIHRKHIAVRVAAKYGNLKEFRCTTMVK